MRIGIQTWGSEGDVRPLLALGMGLAEAGHQVQLAYTSVEGRDWRQPGNGPGLEVRSVGDAELAVQRQQHAARLETVLSMSNPLHQVNLITELFLEPVVDDMFVAALALCESSDIVVAHFLCHPLIAAARQTGKPLVTVFTGPAAPSRHYPPLGVPDLGVLNGWAWRVLARLAGPTLIKSANALRRRHGIPVLPHLFDGTLDEPALLLTAVSPTLFPRPPDWQPHHHVCGTLSMPNDTRAAPIPADLLAFLEAGDPPIFMTFGSMLAVAPKETLEGSQLMLAAAEQAGCRVIVQAPWPELPPVQVPDCIHCVTRVAHHAVFPRCAAVVHHAGAGTTHSASVAGCPSVLVPYVADQAFWSAMLRERGLAPKARKRRQTTPQSLAADMRSVLASPQMRQRAQEVARSMAGEDGVATAVRLIEAMPR